MFTKEDFDQYFGQIARVERKMIYGAFDLRCQIDDPFLVRVLEKIGNDEVRHYGDVLKMLRLALERGQSEKRRKVREYYLGTIQMRSVQDQAAGEIKAYCVHLSKTGICLEGAQDFSVGRVWDLEVRLFGKDESILRSGAILWSKEIESDLYISGIKFEA